MKPSHQSLLDELSSAYAQAEKHMLRYRHILENPKIQTDANVLASAFQKDALRILSNVSGLLSPSKAPGTLTPLSGKASGKAGEERAEKALRRYRKISGRTDSFLELETLLSQVCSMVGELLALNTVKVRRIYATPKEWSGGIFPGDGTWLDQPVTVPKYSVLVALLLERDIDPFDIAVAEESLGDRQLRKNPYKVVYVRLPNGQMRTVCISDQLGEQTYVYRGHINLLDLETAEKWAPVRNVPAEGIRYGENYGDRLRQALFGESEVRIAIDTRTPLEIIGNLSEIIGYQRDILEIREGLAMAGIAQERGVWYFGDAKGCRNWPRAWGKNLVSFPSSAFNKDERHAIGDKDGTIRNPAQLRRLFEVLGFEVATEAQEIWRWARMLLDAEGELAIAGIIRERGIWYFWDIKWSDNWPNVWERNLASFPSCAFIKDERYEIWAKNGTISNPIQLRRLFEALGLAVATEAQEKQRWARMLLDAEGELAIAGIVQERGIWYFEDTTACANWPNVWGKNLISFPGSAFNRDERHAIGNRNGTIVNPAQLRRLFEVLGLAVATEAQEKQRWARMLLDAEGELAIAGIVQERGIWYFWDAKGKKLWPKIRGRHLTGFPNATFNQDERYAIGNAHWRMTNSAHLKKLFEALGFNVATEAQEADRRKRK